MRRSLTQCLWLCFALLLGWSAVACSADFLTSATTNIACAGRNLPSFAYDLTQQPKPGYDGGPALVCSKK